MSIVNAMTELQNLLAEKGVASILAAEVSFNEDFQYSREDVPADEIFTLPMEFTPEQKVAFWKFLDRKYDKGYGGQQLFGTIWLQDGSWFTRGEYDGSEWWAHQKRPPIPRAS